jgi:hypothetical protein
MSLTAVAAALMEAFGVNLGHVAQKLIRRIVRLISCRQVAA